MATEHVLQETRKDDARTERLVRWESPSSRVIRLSFSHICDTSVIAPRPLMRVILFDDRFNRCTRLHSSIPSIDSSEHSVTVMASSKGHPLSPSRLHTSLF